MWIEQHVRGQAEGGISAMELFGVVATVGSLAPASAGSSAVAVGGATTKALPAGRGVWSLGWAARGRRIEQTLGGNLPANCPVIDKFDDITGAVTSIKSLDLSARSYQNANRVYSRLKVYIDKLAAFKGAAWAKTTVFETSIKHRVLQIAVPTAGNTAQQHAIQRAIHYARNAGIQFELVIFP